MVVGAICARGGSKGVPRKNIKPLKGLPLIAYTIVCAQNSKFIDRIVVSTDDEEIAEIAKKYGAEVPFLRPAELAQDTTSKWPVFIHLVENYEKLNSIKVSILADLDIGVPMRSHDDVDGAINLLKTSAADVVITGYEPERNPYFNMVEQKVSGFAGIVKIPDKPIVRRQDAPVVHSLSPAVFAIKKETLYKYSHWSQSNMLIYPVPRERAVDIDSEIDFKFVEFLMEKK